MKKFFMLFLLLFMFGCSNKSHVIDFFIPVDKTGYYTHIVEISTPARCCECSSNYKFILKRSDWFPEGTIIYHNYRGHKYILLNGKLEKR